MHLRRDIWATLTAICLVLLALGAQSYLGRVSLRDELVKGCVRGTRDRYDGAHGWRTAQAETSDPLIAASYGRIAASLESRTSPTATARYALCVKTYRKPTIWPWKG